MIKGNYHPINEYETEADLEQSHKKCCSVFRALKLVKNIVIILIFGRKCKMQNQQNIFFATFYMKYHDCFFLKHDKIKMLTKKPKTFSKI